MKIAIVHEMLVKLGWAEKVVKKLQNIFPEADLFTLIYDEKKVWKVFPKESINKQCFSLSSQKIYNIFKNQRFCLMSMPRSIEALDFSSYDLVIASSSWFAHGAITKIETKFLVYYHSPARYLWDWTNEYKKDIWWDKWLKWFILNKIFLWLREWDYMASSRVDLSLSNSKNVEKRISKYYRKDSNIVYPPVETSRFENQLDIDLSKYNLEVKSYYIIVSALTEFKKIDIAVKSFKNIPDKNLVIIWDWNYRWDLEKLAEDSKNISFLWAKYDEELIWLVQNSSGLIFPGEEDFGIVPIEAMSAWVPVFALKAWWLAETNLDWLTWNFFYEKSWEDFIENFEKFEKNVISWNFKKEDIVKHARKYDEKVFEEKIKKYTY